MSTTVQSPADGAEGAGNAGGAVEAGGGAGAAVAGDVVTNLQHWLP